MTLKILHIVPYPQLFPPKNGGMLRCWNIAKQLSIHFDVDLVCLQANITSSIKKTGALTQKNSMRLITPETNYDLSHHTGFRKIKTAIIFRWCYKTFSSVNSSFWDSLPLWEELDGKQYDYILLEHLQPSYVYKKIRRTFPGVKLILDAHNVDHLLLKPDLPVKVFKKLKRQESELNRVFDAVLVCSDNDKKILENLNRHEIRIFTIPNGVDVKDYSYQNSYPLTFKFNLIFCGSLDYEPNYTGMVWFLENVWDNILKKIPTLQLIIVGRGRPPEELLSKFQSVQNINFIGEVDDVEQYYYNSDLAIVPLLNGSGTRLKILEAMNLGVPVLSTSIGAEGIKYTPEENILIANTSEEFIKQVCDYFAGDKDGILISANAQKLVRDRYSWSNIGTQLQKLFKENLIL